MLYDRNRVPTLVGIAFALLVCGFGWASGPRGLLAAWFTLKLVTAGARVALDASYRRGRNLATAPAWGNRFVVALGLDGFAWSLLILLFAGRDSGELGPVVIAAVIGVASSGIVALSTDRRANTVFAFALLLPGAVRLLLLGTRLGAFGGVAVLLFLGVIIEHGIRAADATAELLRLRFEVAQARDAALAAVKAKTEFLATMSHELRTPLNAVIGMASLLADTDLTADQRERLDLIRTSGETLLSLIGDILDVSKIEAGKLEVESAPVDLARVVEDALDQVAPAAYAKGLELGYEIAEDGPAAIVSDPTRVKQILANLLGNAAKFTSRGSVTVNVASSALDAVRTEVTFAVHDTGVGIDPEALGRLFVPFTQADATTTRRYGGTGLGLAICKSLSELLGGTIGVESTLGEGSTFHFSIVGKALLQPRVRALPINVGSRVCVASDDATARALLCGHVSALGFVASPVASLAAALEVASREETDLVLFDARGPADEAMRSVRALREARATLPIVVLVLPRAASPLRNMAPPDALIATASKPVKTGRLLEVIEALLAGQPAPARQSSIADLEAPKPLDPASGSALVVDDNELNRRVALEMVRRLGLSARAVGSGVDAIEAVRGERFDYVLMDVQMPDMDGFEATRRILDVAGPRKPRIIAMTANALPGDRERCIAAGMSDYVTKPVRPGSLATALRQKYDGAPDGSERSGITDVLDAQVLEDLRMLEETSGATLIADLAASFRGDVPARIADLRAACASADVATVKSIAHRLRGSAGAIGANRVFVSATEIETRASTLSAAEMAPLIEQLAKETRRAVDAFERVLERTRGEGAARKD
jgi:signal transduction histidine kinase/CheY-like chemotaxis protein